jgi:two-component system phosphate regulon sensor histidine kinase PhoR
VKRILVVDDEESIRLTLSTILSKEGYEIQAVGSFDEVAQVLPEFSPDTIILDVLLPKVSGLDILEYLKGQGIEAPVIVITGAPDIQSARESLRRGAYDYIAKPFTLDVLRQSVRRAVNQRELLDTRHELDEQKRQYQEELERQVRARTAELQGRNAELEAIIQNMADGVLVLDKQDRIVVCNPALRNILGISCDDVTGRSITECYQSEEPGFCALWEIGAPSADLMEQLQAMSNQGANDSELPFVVRREVTLSAPLNRIVMVYTTQLRDADLNPLGQVRLVRDITRERELEQMKSDFVSIVSHELRTPLFYIKGFIELLLKGKAEDPKVRGEFLGIIRDQTEHLGRLVEDMLDTSRIEQGNLVLKEERVPVEDLIRHAAADAEGLAANAGVTLLVEVPDTLTEVLGDFVRLKQVMANLIGNAIKFSKPGDTTIIRALPKPGEIWVQVQDQGPGISPKNLPHLFDKFYQADSSQTRSSSGVGLGLYIARQIVENLGGRIWAESELDIGSVFTFALPMRQVGAGKDSEATGPSEGE